MASRRSLCIPGLALFIASLVSPEGIFAAGSSAAVDISSFHTLTESTNMNKTTGSFEVKMTPLSDESDIGDASVGRMNLHKTFHGGLDAVGKGQMLTMMTPIEGSAAYVAMERVSGSLEGRTGSFALQHSGTMNRGAQRLSIQIVPDSGTEQLTGIAGSLHIEIVDGKHFYTLEYSLP